ncbi:MAG TPA: response regulator [Planctomycetota bacterium]|nr:response regulator [Planctomycetota bacterium]
MEPSEQASILLVDDRQDKLLALEVILADLGQNIVRAQSGKEALRCLLTQEFACILLDVNMPGLDGFETASLIRQRKNTEHTPIIFVTSISDSETHVNRGYSLGAVDYILSPIMPDVLRAKVNVFVELYKKNLQLQKQASSLQLQAERLQMLNQASVAIHSAHSIDAILKLMTEHARRLSGARCAIATTSVSQVWSSSTRHISLDSSLRASPLRDSEILTIYSMLGAANRPLRMTAEQWQSHQKTMLETDAGPPYSGWEALPLLARDGESIGMLCVAGKDSSEFVDSDEAILLQLAQLGSIAIENTLNYEAREANKIKDEFLATLSHELRTPLTSVLAWTRMLRSGQLDNEKRNRGLEIIERNVRTQTKLIDDLLDISRIIVGKLRLHIRALDLCSLLESVADAIRPAADDRGVALTLDLDRTVPKLLGDPERLQQVFSNLIWNALKFSEAGGKVLIKLECVESRVRVSVIDNGAGIDPEFLPHVFDRFRQADSSSTRTRSGLGLGLAIVRHLTELHGGSVSAHSEGLGKGCSFKVTLPIVAVKLTTVSPADGQLPKLSVNSVIDLASHRILIVDDESDSRETLAEVLKGTHATVMTASRAAEALELLKVFRPTLLVSDLGMPEEDGYSLIRKVRKLPPEECGQIPAIALTAYAREEDRRQALESGFQLHLSKPVEPADLIAAVALYCQQEQAKASVAVK